MDANIQSYNKQGYNQHTHTSKKCSGFSEHHGDRDMDQNALEQMKLSIKQINRRLEQERAFDSAAKHGTL